MAEDKKKSSKRATRQRGLFSGPADPLMGGMGAPPRPKRKAKPTPKPAAVAPRPKAHAAPSSEPDGQQAVEAQGLAQAASSQSTPTAAPSAQARTGTVEVPPFPSRPEPTPPPAPRAEPEKAAAPARGPRPAGISLSDRPSSPAEPDLSPFPASMRLRMAKAKSKAEKLSAHSQPPTPPAPPAPAPPAPAPEPPTPEPPAPEPEPEPEHRAPLNDDPRGRITLPPPSQRGAGPASWEEADGGFDLLQDPSESTGMGLMDMVPDEQDGADEGFDAPGRSVANLNVIENVPDSFGKDQSDGDVDASAWNDHHTDHNAPFDITARRDSYEEDLEEPPSELVNLDQLPRGVIVRDEKANDGFTHRVSPRPLVEDAGVWHAEEEHEEATPPPAEPRHNRAWWEERVGDENSQQGKVSPLPARAPKEAPSFLGKTRQEREAEKRRRAAMLGGGVSLVILLIIAAFVLLSQRTPSPDADPPQVMVPPSAELPALPEKVPDPVQDPEPPAVVDTPPELPETPELGSGLPGEDPTPEGEADPMAIDPGFLNIRAEPRAVIFLNGKNLGQTPLERIELPPGEHTFKAVAPGKRAQVRTVRVDSGQAQRIIFRF